MSVTEILERLPKLAFEERRKIIDCARALNKEEAEREAFEICEASADALFDYLDTVESKNEAYRAR
jgi:hypothetical protein